MDHIRKDLINFVYELNAYHGVWKKHQDLLSALWDQAGDESTYHDADQQMKALEIALTAEEIDAVPSIVRDPEPDYHEEDDHYLERLAASLAYLLKSPYWTPERWDVFEGKVALFAIRERMGLKAKLLCLRNWRNDFGNVWETGMAGQAYDGASCVDFFANEQREFPPAASAYETARSIYDYLTAFRYDAPWLPIVDECYLSNLDATDFWCKS